MVQNLLVDPFKMWKNVYEQAEANWNEMIQQSMRKETFSKSMGETLNYNLQFQENSKKLTEAYLKLVNMPTRSELADVAMLIINLEEKVDGLDSKFDEEVLKMDGVKDIGQLRKAVAILDRKLDKVIETIEVLDKVQLVEVTKE